MPTRTANAYAALPARHRNRRPTNAASAKAREAWPLGKEGSNSASQPYPMRVRTLGRTPVHGRGRPTRNLIPSVRTTVMPSSKRKSNVASRYPRHPQRNREEQKEEAAPSVVITIMRASIAAFVPAALSARNRTSSRSPTKEAVATGTTRPDGLRPLKPAGPSGNPHARVRYRRPRDGPRAGDVRPTPRAPRSAGLVAGGDAVRGDRRRAPHAADRVAECGNRNPKPERRGSPRGARARGRARRSHPKTRPNRGPPPHEACTTQGVLPSSRRRIGWRPREILQPSDRGGACGSPRPRRGRTRDRGLDLALCGAPSRLRRGRVHDPDRRENRALRHGGVRRGPAVLRTPPASQSRPVPGVPRTPRGPCENTLPACRSGMRCLSVAVPLRLRSEPKAIRAERSS